MPARQESQRKSLFLVGLPQNLHKIPLGSHSKHTVLFRPRKVPCIPLPHFGQRLCLSWVAGGLRAACLFWKHPGHSFGLLGERLVLAPQVRHVTLREV
jgi:hypothetical protein